MPNAEAKLSLVQAQLGPMANFVYIIGDPSTHKAAVVRTVTPVLSKGTE